MKIGKYELIPVWSGFFKLDGGAMFGVVPKVLWNKTNPSDEFNRIKLSTTSLLLKSESRNILIDTGLGNKYDQKFENIYGIKNRTIDSSLKLLNIETDSITDVIITHLHFDHTGGSTKKFDNEILPTFRNAKYYVQKKQFEWALNPSEKDKASFLKDDFLPLYDFNQLILLEGEVKLDDELEILISNGHTPFQQHLKISDGKTTVFYCGDLIPTTSHLPLPYVMAYDLFPLTTMEEKMKILNIAFEENWILFFEHDPEIFAATLKRGDKRFETDKIIWKKENED